MDAICAIDLDTLLPVYLASNKKGIPRMYDAHEFFTEMIEVKRRPHINYAWKKLEEWLVPKFKNGYTVGKTIALDLNTLYGVQYQVIRNIPIYEPPRLQTDPPPPAIQQILDQFNRQCPKPGPFVFYQGALNEGRALLPMLEAMKSVPARMLMAGSGNMEAEVKKFIADHQLEDKVYLCGNISPDLLKHLTAKCFCGITLYDAFSKNQYYSLGNKFFDYMMAQKPQVCVNYPEYTAILQEHPFALPIPDVLPATISGALNNLLADGVLYSDLQNECKKASLVLNWEKESQILRRQWDAIW